MTPYSDWQLAGPYGLEDAANGLGFVYPPSGAYLLWPFTLGEAFWYAWNVVSIVAVIGIVLLMVHREVGRMSAPWHSRLEPSRPLPSRSGSRPEDRLSVTHGGCRDGQHVALASLVGHPVSTLGLIKIFPAMGLLWTIRKNGVWKVPLLVAAVIAVLITVAQPTYFTDWLTALGNAEPGCPENSLWSFACRASRRRSGTLRVWCSCSRPGARSATTSRSCFWAWP